MRLRQSLSLTQRLALAERLLGSRLALVGALRGERYRLGESCPRCRRRLTAVEVMRGFRRDPHDFTTRCRRCRHRFQPKLALGTNGSRTAVPFFCRAQTALRLPPLSSLAPTKMKRDEPALYHAAIVYWGSLRAAFAAINVSYAFPELSPELNWRAKIAPFLGRLPDTEVARACNTRVGIIRAFRRERGIPAFTHAMLAA